MSIRRRLEGFFARRRARAARAAAERALVASSGLFDTGYYEASSPDVRTARIDPVTHFCAHGWREGRRPNAWFDPAWYRATYLASAPSLNPLVHYVRTGESAGCRPVAALDAAWYRFVFGLTADVPVLRHRLANRSARPPAPDVAAELDREIAGLVAAPPEPEADDDRALIAGSGLFDENFYLINGVDVHRGKIDPLKHYCEHGWREGRRPNACFDSTWYRDVYLADAPDANPLLHYIRAGEQGGCRPIAYFEPGWYRAAYGLAPDASPLAHYIVHRRSQRVAPNPRFDLAAYLACHGEEIGPNRDPFAHLIRWGPTRDTDATTGFDSAPYRAAVMPPPDGVVSDIAAHEMRVPLVHYLDRLVRIAVQMRRYEPR